MTLVLTHLPYCLKQLRDGSYMVLNFNMRPVGDTTSGQGAEEDFEGHPARVYIRELTPHKAERMGLQPSMCTLKRPTFFLYDATTLPSTPHNRDRYLATLGEVMRLMAEPAS